ncbi:hypothetical protein Tco_0718819 [Tanacetum coccineum]
MYNTTHLLFVRVFVTAAQVVYLQLLFQKRRLYKRGNEPSNEEEVQFIDDIEKYSLANHLFCFYHVMIGALRFFIKRSFKRMDNFKMLDFRKAEEENEANKQRVLELAKDDKKKLTSMPSLNLFEDHSYDSSNYINVENLEALDYEDAHHGMSFQKTPKLHF